MKRSLSHLPEQKKAELRRVVEIITGIADVEMIILFGSYARGDWVEDRYQEGHITYEYQSDFDILIIVEKSGFARTITPWEKMERAFEKNPVIRTPVSLIVHDIKDINKKIAWSEYFFTDIKREGIFLYNSKRFRLARRRKLRPEERQLKARTDYEYWFGLATDIFDTFESDFQKKKYNWAAFELHQATEHAYTAILLVFTGYKPKLHDLKKLRRRANQFDRRFVSVFPRQTQEERRLFNLLCAAYVDARYNKNYTISEEELRTLANAIQHLHQLTQEICLRKIESYYPS